LVERFPFRCGKLWTGQVAFSGETQSRSVNRYIDVFGKPVDEAKHFGKGRSSLEASSGMSFRRKRCSSVQHTQKSFSIAVAVELRRLAVSSKKGRRSVASSFAKVSIFAATP